MVRYLIEAPLLWLSVTLLASGVFVADTLTDREIAFAVLYAAVILVSVRAGRPRAILTVGSLCAILTIVSYVLTKRGAQESGLMNCVLSLLAIGATTFLTMRIEVVEARTRLAQAALARMSRLTTIGELGTSIAHEVSQPVTAIAANGNAALRWLSAAPPNLEEAESAIRRIVQDAERAGEVIGRVRRLIARVPPSRDPIDIVEVISEALALVRAELRNHDILLRTEFATDLPPVTGDRIQMQQVVLNFLMNAIEAMAGVDPARRDLLVCAARDDRTITVSVRDTGTGLPGSGADGLFEAFQTTKPMGMGMGLTISRSIIEAHRGRIYAAANFPHGAVFGFTLPIIPVSKGETADG
ncbi:Histidine kinase-, DNA gyrase B-, and HSP90-like ATPase [Rhizobium sp. RU35A]|uniref:histidine kinase n=1 Tax=Rhizobium straminoryzae TaxID=1387186 RepID=A0A549SW03_9HYPH|nr:MULTISPECIES: ATP-binding protein [Rhizobium]TRL33800.1 serine/threonine protein kinase [Rhizobium straminoryzae]SIQ87093.1 Histidine kinase-, DNA gyrase B-, and HSP90-like ATPase [Rhizobium sp. RU35A]